MTAKVNSRPPVLLSGAKAYKPYGLGALVRRLRQWVAMSSEESWCMVHFTLTGEVFEIDGRGIWRLYRDAR